MHTDARLERPGFLTEDQLPAAAEKVEGLGGSRVCVQGDFRPRLYANQANLKVDPGHGIHQHLSSNAGIDPVGGPGKLGAVCHEE
jgi:hypothetical protein